MKFLLAYKSDNTSVLIDDTTNAMCLLAIETSDIYFSMVAFKTEEMCKLAVQKSAENASHIPTIFFTAEFMLTLIKINPDVIAYIPVSICLDFPEIVLKALQKNPMLIKSINAKILREEHVLTVVSTNGMLLRYVPLHLRTSDVCLAAMKQNPYAFPHVVQIGYSSNINVETLEISLSIPGTIECYVASKSIESSEQQYSELVHSSQFS